jgi:glycerol uptake operon antiterminator
MSEPEVAKASVEACRCAPDFHPERRATHAELGQAMRHQPIIASVTDPKSLDQALDSAVDVVFLLYGSLLDLAGTVEKVRDAGRTCLVDVDLLEGFAGQPVVIEHLARDTEADGILSARAPMVKAAKAHGLVAGHRFFLVDTRTYRSIPSAIGASGADFIEAQPGAMPRVISWLREEIAVPIVAGGLIIDAHDIQAALDAGASAVATSNRNLWPQ